MTMAHEHDTRFLMRMRFELARDDNPPLFDDLMKFAKGTKRLNRLRTLAHEGLFAQRGWALTPTGAVAPSKAMAQPPHEAASVLSAASSELFGPAADA